ncbi:hypothetical protein QA635_19560 [Bradyrhizobium brasilense]|uniref:hypothetical protein n=1 Tax=Bradyrhizobium brasilense TaxID=1419277 RepID=UPI0024B1C0C2|nr:hypothetical protein [Bradyrhizobium australafricanum]WFU36490.1 hypothetical protein QA635_19560 [Bradyrhizobium australafricanum]
MANNQQNFGFGGRPHFRNESVPLSPTGNVVASPLPGMMMTINAADALNVLPPAAREKVEGIKLRREELGALYRESFASEQATRAEIFQIEARIRGLQKPRGDGGPDLDSDDFRVVTEQKRLDRARADLNRLLAAREPREAESTLLGRLLQNIEAAIAARPAGTIGAMVEIDVPAVKDVLGAVEAKRRRLRELESDLARCRHAPHPSADRKRAMIAQVEALAEQGRPDVTGSIEHAEPIGFPAQSRQVEIHNVPGGGAIGFSEQPNSIGLIAWLFKDALIAALDREIDEAADDGEALTIEQRRERETEILRDMLATAREEVMLVDRAEKQGQHVAHRADIDPLALLQIAWIAAPPAVPQEGAGEAGLVRTVGL